ncbi:hypothetical protein SESBI_19195 [Sesbania bispinosa]|nr:hypothetical protein SESBI_19195 [Sesbania bispinosa]
MCGECALGQKVCQDYQLRRGDMPKSQTGTIANQWYMLVQHSHVLLCKESSKLSGGCHYKEVLFGNKEKEAKALTFDHEQSAQTVPHHIPNHTLK